MRSISLNRIPVSGPIAVAAGRVQEAEESRDRAQLLEMAEPVDQLPIFVRNAPHGRINAAGTAKAHEPIIMLLIVYAFKQRAEQDWDHLDLNPGK